MPQTDGARRVLERLDAAPDGKKKVYWTSLREEPVIYVAGRPHVLRLVDRPLQNVEYVTCMQYCPYRAHTDNLAELLG